MTRGVCSTAVLCSTTAALIVCRAAHKRYGLKCKFSPDSTMLVTTSADQTAKLWSSSDRKLITVNAASMVPSHLSLVPSRLSLVLSHLSLLPSPGKRRHAAKSPKQFNLDFMVSPISSGSSAAIQRCVYDVNTKARLNCFRRTLF